MIGVWKINIDWHKSNQAKYEKSDDLNLPAFPEIKADINEINESLAEKEEIKKKNIREECSSNDECVLPDSYAIRSTCPFEAKCVDGKCAVICPPQYSSAENEFSEIVKCQKDADCNCAYYVASDLKKCVCLNEICSAIVDF